MASTIDIAMENKYDTISISVKDNGVGFNMQQVQLSKNGLGLKNLEARASIMNGSFDVEGFQTENLESNGSFTGKNIEIIGEAVFNGGIKITNGKLNDIKIATMRTTFTDIVVNGNIFFKKANKEKGFFGFTSNNQSSVQVLELKGRSLIIGDIIFEENGEIHLFDLAEVKGKIVNAKVIQK